MAVYMTDMYDSFELGLMLEVTPVSVREARPVVSIRSERLPLPADLFIVPETVLYVRMSRPVNQARIDFESQNATLGCNQLRLKPQRCLVDKRRDISDFVKAGVK